MKQIHQDSNHPSQPFLQQYSLAFNKLPTHAFTPLGKLRLQVDTGANVHAVTNSNMLIFYIPCATQVRNINGETFESPGWGACVYTYKDKSYLLSPVYVCPNNPHNTVSLGALQSYSSFKRTIIETHSKLELYANNEQQIILDVTTDNGLDYVELNLSTFDPQNNHRQPSINNIQFPNDKTSSSFF